MSRPVELVAAAWASYSEYNDDDPKEQIPDAAEAALWLLDLGFGLPPECEPVEGELAGEVTDHEGDTNSLIAGETRIRLDVVYEFVVRETETVIARARDESALHKATAVKEIGSIVEAVLWFADELAGLEDWCESVNADFSAEILERGDQPEVSSDDDWHADPLRLLRYERGVSDAERRLLTMAAELLWDDLLCCVEDNRVREAQLINLLPAQFRERAAEDWRRWFASFSAVLWKLAQPWIQPSASMAEQILVGALVDYAESDVMDLARDDLLELDEPLGDIELDQRWLENYLQDRDHEILSNPALDGIDDLTTEFQYGFGRMDYEGAFAVFNEANEDLHGCPHPMAELRMNAPEMHREQQRRSEARLLSLVVAQAVVRGESVVRIPSTVSEPEIAIRRAGKLLKIGISLRDNGVEIEIRTPTDPSELDLLQHWLDDQA